MLGVLNALVLPIALIVLGFFLMGYIFPELLENVTPYSRTIWMPLGFVVASIIGTYLLFEGSTIPILMGGQWCAITPCIPIHMVIFAFVLGDFAKFGTMRLAKEKIDWFGEKIKD
jgi:hypothetical protein